MFRKVVQRFTNAATKPGCLRPFQRSLLQQESALLNAYESNGRNVTGLSYKKNTTKVQQLETFSTQYTGVSKFLLDKTPAGGSSGIAKTSLGRDVQFKKLGDTARLNPALCHSESQPVRFGPSQQAVKNILAKGEKSDTLNGTWGLMQNPISYSFREGEMGKENQQGASENQQLETPKSENKELKDENQQLEALKSENEKLKGQNQQLEELKSTNEGKIQQLESQVRELEALKSENEKLKGQNQRLEELKSKNEELNTKLQESENRNKELEDNKDSKPSAVNVQGVKSKVNYVSASFILSGVCAVGASLATPYLAICAILAIAASVFLALGCYCLYKANTALSDVKVDQPDNQRLLESRP